MKLLVAVKSCLQHQIAGYHQVIRDTWGKDFAPPTLVKFFTGPNLLGDRELIKYERDEIALDCPDDYNSLPKKTRAICQWATSKALDGLFLCDTDTYLVPAKLMSAGFQGFDYAGKIDKPLGQPFMYKVVSREGEIIPQLCYPWASGGFGYFLSRRAFTLIANAEPAGWAEDLWVGQVLGPRYSTSEITMLHTPGGEYSWHFPAHEYNSGYDLKFGWMQRMYLEQR